MGTDGSIRFCDACGRTMAAGERLTQSGQSWVCADCHGATTPLPVAMAAPTDDDYPTFQAPPPRRTYVAPARKRTSGLGKASLVAGLVGIGLGLIPGIGLVGIVAAGIGWLLALIGLILALAVPNRREGAGVPVLGLIVCFVVPVIILIVQAAYGQALYERARDDAMAKVRRDADDAARERERIYAERMKTFDDIRRRNAMPPVTDEDE